MEHLAGVDDRAKVLEALELPDVAVLEHLGAALHAVKVDNRHDVRFNILEHPGNQFSPIDFLDEIRVDHQACQFRLDQRVQHVLRYLLVHDYVPAFVFRHFFECIFSRRLDWLYIHDLCDAPGAMSGRPRRTFVAEQVFGDRFRYGFADSARRNAVHDDAHFGTAYFLHYRRVLYVRHVVRSKRADERTHPGAFREPDGRIYAASRVDEHFVCVGNVLRADYFAEFRDFASAEHLTDIASAIEVKRLYAQLETVEQYARLCVLVNYYALDFAACQYRRRRLGVSLGFNDNVSARIKSRLDARNVFIECLDVVDPVVELVSRLAVSSRL